MQSLLQICVSPFGLLNVFSLSQSFKKNGLTLGNLREVGMRILKVGVRTPLVTTNILVPKATGPAPVRGRLV